MATAILEDLLSNLTAGDDATRLQRADVQVGLSQMFSAANQAATLARVTEVVATRKALLAPRTRILSRRGRSWHGAGGRPDVTRKQSPSRANACVHS